MNNYKCVVTIVMDIKAYNPDQAKEFITKRLKGGYTPYLEIVKIEPTELNKGEIDGTF